MDAYYNVQEFSNVFKNVLKTNNNTLKQGPSVVGDPFKIWITMFAAVHYSWQFDGFPFSKVYFFKIRFHGIFFKWNRKWKKNSLVPNSFFKEPPMYPKTLFNPLLHKT